MNKGGSRVWTYFWLISRTFSFIFRFKSFNMTPGVKWSVYWWTVDTFELKWTLFHKTNGRTVKERSRLWTPVIFLNSKAWKWTTVWPRWNWMVQRKSSTVLVDGPTNICSKDEKFWTFEVQSLNLSLSPSLTGPGPRKIRKSRTEPDQNQHNLENLGPYRTKT